MNKYLVIFSLLVFWVSVSLSFIFSWGWIVIVTTLPLLAILLIIPYQGSIIESIRHLRKQMKTLNKREDLQDKNFKNYGKNVALALSGGVDSAVAASLLKDQGYNVTCFFMKNWDSNSNYEKNREISEKGCDIENDYDDAKIVANQLGLNLIKLNFVKEYWNKVFSKFLYDIEKKGITPNPDVLCNKYIKFGIFIDYIKKNADTKFDFYATGHYAKIIENNDRYYLGQAIDPIKDQTYFLSRINKDILGTLKFPLGDFTKEEVRAIAKEKQLSVYNKKDSTGICFVGERNFSKFMENYLDVRRGNIVDSKTKKIIGKHKGAIFYTIGQRRGLDLGGQTKPYYVSSKDTIRNIVYVSNHDDKNLYSKIFYSKDFNDLTEDISNYVSKEITIKYRHSAERYNAKFTIKTNKNNTLHLKIILDEKAKFVTPGQEVVLYYEDICLGGGEIYL